MAHGGGIEGFATEIRRYTDDQVTIIILSNRDTTGVRVPADLIAQAIFEDQEKSRSPVRFTALVLMI